MNNIETLVCVEIEERLNQMSESKPTDEEYKASADVTLKLIDREAKLRELELQAEANKLKEKELEESRKRRIADVIVKSFETVAKFSVPAALAIGLTIYEQSDSAASTATKEFWKKVFRLM